MNLRSATPSIGKSTALILIGVAVVLVGRAHSLDSEPSLTKDRPVLEVDLRKFGYDTSGDTRPLHAFVDFTDSNHLAFAWLMLDDPIAAKKIRGFARKPAHLQLLLLDATTGQKQGQKEWPTASYPVRLLGFRHGRFLTCTENIVRLFSSSFELIREQILPTDRLCLDSSLSEGRGVSPSRRLFLLSSQSGKSDQSTLLDLETFATVANWTEKVDDISDQWLVGRCSQPLQVCIRSIFESWRPFEPAGLDKQMSDPMKATALFVNDTTLMIEAWNKMAVATVDGKVLFQVNLPKNRSFGGLGKSSGGERFAVIENRQRGPTIEFLDLYAYDWSDRLVVYSIPDRRAIYAVKVKGGPPWPSWQSPLNGFALSPDGTLLALISEGILKIYRLPERTSRSNVVFVP